MEERFKKVRSETFEMANKVISTIKKKYKFDELPLGEQKQLIEEIQEGLLDAADHHHPQK